MGWYDGLGRMNGTWVRHGTGAWDVGAVHTCHCGGDSANYRVKHLVRRLAHARFHTERTTNVWGCLDAHRASSAMRFDH